MIARFAARLRDDRRGAALLEFALLAPPFLLLLLGSFDMAYQAYARAATQGAVETLTRSATVQNADEAAIRQRLTETVRAVVPSGTIAIARGSVSRFSDFGAMERLTLDLNGNGQLDGPVDTDGNGVPDKSDCWEDVDGNGVRNVVTVGKDSMGGADDIVRYSVTVTFDRLFPIWRLFGMPTQSSVNATTLVRRQPYEAQKEAAVRCAT